jgi:hypothetical protein
MKMEHHMAVSVPVCAGVWFTTHSWFYVVMAFSLGVLIDFDHVFDYVREEGRFDMADMFTKSYHGDFHHLYVIFHAFEYVPIAWIAGFFMHNFTFSLVFTVAYLGHMIPDQLMNNVRPWGYFMIYRIKKEFVMRDIFYKGKYIDRQS